MPLFLRKLVLGIRAQSSGKNYAAAIAYGSPDSPLSPRPDPTRGWNIVSQMALKNIFTKRGQSVDSNLTQMLIREVGIYPPGSFVKLVNGDVAIVIKRAIVKKNRDTTSPSVCSVISPRGGLYERHTIRDSNLDMFKITEMCLPEIDEPINYQKLWGY